MARTDNLSNYLEDVATAIKNKKGDNTPINASEFDTEIEKLPNGGDISEYVNTIYDSNNSGTSSQVGGWYKSIIKLPHINITGQNIALTSMFRNCNTTEIDISDSEVVTPISISYMFSGCAKLKIVNMNNLDLQAVTLVNTTFNSCTNLEKLTFGSNLGKGYTENSANYTNYTLAVSSCTKLTHESLMDIINKLYNLNLVYSGKLYTQQLILGSENLAKLTANEIAIATNKGWVVS